MKQPSLWLDLTKISFNWPYFFSWPASQSQKSHIMLIAVFCSCRTYGNYSSLHFSIFQSTRLFFFHVSSTKSQMAHNHCSRAVLLLEDAAICLLHLKRATEVSNLLLALVQLPRQKFIWLSPAVDLFLKQNIAFVMILSGGERQGL